MTTDFEFIEINDNTGIGRKVAGDFETQGADDLFHQTARNLNTRLEVVTGVTLQSATPTDIALNGMESHVLLDIGSRIENDIIIQLQYFAGGPFYAAQWHKLQPHRFRGGKTKNYWYPADTEGWNETDTEASNVVGGTHVFAIPTFGAVTCRLQLYGSSVTKTGVSWARVVMNTPPVMDVVSKSTRLLDNEAVNVPTGLGGGYDVGDAVGGSIDLVTGVSTPGSAQGLVTIKSLSIGPRSFGAPTLIGDVDVVITPFDLGMSDGGAVSATTFYVPDVSAILEFRSVPGPGQYRMTDFAGQKIGMATDLNINTMRECGPNSPTFGSIVVIAREAIAGADVGVNGLDVAYTLDFG